MRVTRLQKIVEYTQKTGVVSFSDLCREFDASSSTMRRDLNELASKGLIEKVHGGARAITTSQTVEPPYNKRLNMNVEEKKRIAKYAFSIIHEKDIIILDSSTTTTELAKLLTNTQLNLKVITNDAQIACMLTYTPNIETIIVGGSIRRGFFTALGIFSEYMWKQFHANKLFLGIDAIDPELGAMGYQTEEIRSKQVMVERCDQCIVLCDHTKFASSSLLQICPISSIDTIITGKELDDATLKDYEKFSSLKIIRA